MTFCAAFKTANDIYIMSDTAVTSDAPKQHDSSSFGQTCASPDGMAVEEISLKIKLLPNNIVVTCAGDVRLIDVMVSTIISYLESGTDIVAALNMSLTTNGPFGETIDLQMIVAYFENGEPKIVSFNSSGDMSINEEVNIQIGSLAGHYPKLINDVIDIIHSERVPRECMLVRMIAFIQHLGIHDDLTKMYVAGAITGGILNNDTFTWQPDIMDIIYNDDGERVTSCDISTTAVRDDVLIIKSEHTKNRKVLMNSVNTPDRVMWEQKWCPSLKGQFPLGWPKYYVWMSIRKRTVIIVRKVDVSKGKYFTAKPTGDDDIDVSIEEGFSSILTEHNISENDEAMSLKIGWYDG